MINLVYRHEPLLSQSEYRSLFSFLHNARQALKSKGKRFGLDFFTKRPLQTNAPCLVINPKLDMPPPKRPGQHVQRVCLVAPCHAPQAFPCFVHEYIAAPSQPWLGELLPNIPLQAIRIIPASITLLLTEAHGFLHSDSKLIVERFIRLIRW